MDKLKEIEFSLTKKYRTCIYRKIVKALNQFNMISPDDKIGICISGGKDSMLLAKCMQIIQMHWKFRFELEYIVMDPGYNTANRKQIEDNAKLLNLPIQIFNSQIFEAVSNVKQSPCYLCARMRRGHLYHFAKQLGCNKIALGHHFDDVIETVLLSMFYGAEYKTMMPKLKSTNHEGMELIRPMYLVHEEDIIKWKEYHNLNFLQCACKFTEGIVSGKTSSKRTEIKQLIKELKKINPSLDKNIFSSLLNVNLSTILGYTTKEGFKSFLDNY